MLNEQQMVWELYARGIAHDRAHAQKMVDEDRVGAQRALDYLRSKDTASVEEWGHADLGDAA